MKAIVLAAGRGERMRPLTDDRPKPLLEAGGLALIDWHLHALADAGVREVVVNLAWQGARLREHLGSGERYGLAVTLSDEGPEALETGGGIHRALPWLGPGPFLVVNGDVWTDYPPGRLALPAGSWAHLVLADNPSHHPRGDFSLDPDGRLGRGEPRLTYAGLGAYHPDLFAACSAGKFPLAPLLDAAIVAGKATAEHHRGAWFDVGTPARLAELDGRLRRGELAHPAQGWAVK
ncbi:MAG: nucleotidyltransferase family protein [Steroidobacteraceae bacterium]|nr:nucleotidyltransferase family protein [Steroidobacteraceae bacterium]